MEQYIGLDVSLKDTIRSSHGDPYADDSRQRSSYLGLEAQGEGRVQAGGRRGRAQICSHHAHYAQNWRTVQSFC